VFKVTFLFYQYMLIALTLLVTQGIGLAHSIEHRDRLQAGYVHCFEQTQHTNHSNDELLHSCLLFDALTTAHAVVSNLDLVGFKLLLASLDSHQLAFIIPLNRLFSQVVRVRDPPLFS
jgi:hypothetical protein